MALPGLTHRKPHIKRVSAGEVRTAHTTASQQHTPSPVSQCSLVVKHLDCDDGVIGQLVIHGRLHVGELGVEGVLGPGDMAGLVRSRYLHQRVGQVAGLEGHGHTCSPSHSSAETCAGAECWLSCDAVPGNRLSCRQPQPNTHHCMQYAPL